MDSQERSFLSRRRMALIALLAGALGACPSPATTQPVCDGYIGPGETVVLTEDLGPCDGDYEALLVESGTLDLGGHTVSCGDTNGDGVLPYGIVLIGKKAQLRNGKVVGCYHNVILDDKGKHTVEGVTAEGAQFDGFQVWAARNRLSGNTAQNNGDDGIQVAGAKNKVEDNDALGNGEDGVDVVDAASNKLSGNRAEGNVDDGFDVGGNRNKLSGNESTANIDTGIRVGGARNRILGNTATGNGSVDIHGSEPCSANKFKDNVFGTTGSSCVK